MDTPETLTYRTPAVRTIAAAVFLVALIVAGNIATYQVKGKIFNPLWMLVLLGFGTIFSHYRIALEPAAITFKRGFSKKTFPLKGTTFLYGQHTGAIALLQSFTTHSCYFRIQPEGQKESVHFLNITRADFEALMAAMRERGANLEPAPFYAGKRK